MIKKFAEHKARNIIGYNAQIDQIEDVPGKDRPEKMFEVPEIQIHFLSVLRQKHFIN